MQNECIVFEISSITYSQKAMNILRKYKIKSQIKKVVDGIDGCGYRLKVYGDTVKAKNILKQYNIPLRGISDC